jgi:hypothetical protein
MNPTYIICNFSSYETQDRNFTTLHVFLLFLSISKIGEYSREYSADISIDWSAVKPGSTGDLGRSWDPTVQEDLAILTGCSNEDGDGGSDDGRGGGSDGPPARRWWR